ncbi:MAG: hypothetical protein GX817_01260 [Elusimicrobia bacterium]|nr:hypothetical protein [Elusimicrobiota bacterium]
MFSIRVRAVGVICAFLILMSGCAARMEQMKLGMLSQSDVEMVRGGLPTPVLLFDGLTRAYPRKRGILFTASQLNTAYGSLLMIEGAENSACLYFLKARDYAFQSLYSRNRHFRNWFDMDFDEYSKHLLRFRKKDVPYMYYAGQAWLMWVIADGSWNSVADVPKIEELLRRIIELDEEYNYGMAHALLGAVYTSRPAIQGGRPDEAKKHFDRALELSRREVLLIQVLYARQYAKLVYDRPLHDELLEEVLEANLQELPEDMQIMNMMAIEDAKRLLESGDEYF